MQLSVEQRVRLAVKPEVKVGQSLDDDKGCYGRGLIWNEHEPRAGIPRYFNVARVEVPKLPP